MVLHEKMNHHREAVQARTNRETRLTFWGVYDPGTKDASSRWRRLIMDSGRYCRIVIRAAAWAVSSIGPIVWFAQAKPDQRTAPVPNKESAEWIVSFNKSSYINSSNIIQSPTELRWTNVFGLNADDGISLVSANEGYLFLIKQ
jgi:hypothetical protein